MLNSVGRVQFLEIVSLLFTLAVFVIETFDNCTEGVINKRMSDLNKRIFPDILINGIFSMIHLQKLAATAMNSHLFKQNQNPVIQIQ